MDCYGDRVQALELRVAALEAGRPGWVDVADATAEGLDLEERILGALNLRLDLGETMPELAERLLDELEATQRQLAAAITERNQATAEAETLRRSMAETMDSLTALVQPRELRADVDRCERCGDPLDRPTGSECCSQ